MEQVIVPWFQDIFSTPNPASHPDVHIVRPSSKNRNITIDQMHGLMAQLHQTSYSGGWKAGVILEADRLRQEGANAFLKTLEEPSPRTVIVLVTARPTQLLPTIVSRCLMVRMLVREDNSLPAELYPVRDFLASKQGREPLDACRASATLERYLQEQKAQCEEDADDQLKRAKASGVEGKGLEDVEKTLLAEAQSTYVGLRRQILASLAEAVGPGESRVIRLLDEAATGLNFNMPENLVFTRCFLRIAAGA